MKVKIRKKVIIIIGRIRRGRGIFEIKIVFPGQFGKEWQSLLRKGDVVRFPFCGIERQHAEGSLLCESNNRREKGRCTEDKSEKKSNY